MGCTVLDPGRELASRPSLDDDAGVGDCRVLLIAGNRARDGRNEPLRPVRSALKMPCVWYHKPTVRLIPVWLPCGETMETIVRSDVSVETRVAISGVEIQGA